MKTDTGIMLVAFDGSPSSKAALEWAKSKAPLLSLDIEVVNVWEYVESALDVAGVGFGVAASGVFNEMANQMFRGNASQEGRSPLDGARTQSRRYAEPIDESVAISCASCHTELPAGAKFCIKCGQTVGQNQCASCGTDVGLDAQFCPNCGTRIRSSDG